MTFKCQNCGEPIPDAQALDEMEIPEGDELVLHQQNDPDALGVLTDYYCNTGCFVEAKT